MSEEWFIIIGGKETGPFSGVQLQELVANGQITPTTSIRQSRMAHPAPAAEIPGLFSIQITKPDPAAAATPVPSAEDRDPFMVWGLAALVVMVLLLVGFFCFNGPSPKETGKKVAEETPVAKDAAPAVPQPVSEFPSPEPEGNKEPEELSPEEEAILALKEQDLAIREWNLKQQEYRIRLKKAAEERAEKEAEQKAQGTIVPEVDLEAERKRKEELDRTRSAFATNYPACWKRMKALARKREERLIEPFYSALEEAKSIVQQNKGRKRAFRITELKEKIKGLETLRKTQQAEYNAITEDLKKFYNASFLQAKADDLYDPFAQAWKTMYLTHRIAETEYDELGKSLKQCLDVDPDTPMVINYKELVTAKKSSDTGIQKLETMVISVEPLAKSPGGTD